MFEQEYQQYAKRWLRGIPCRPPCWEGVTPGQTTVAEAVAVLNGNSGIVPGSVTTSESPRANIGYVTWKWVGSTHGGEARYALDTPAPTIYQISPCFECVPGDSSAFTLADVMQAYGEPSHIQAHAFYGRHGEGPLYTVAYWYLPLGLSIEENRLHQTKPTLHVGMQFNQVNFYPVRQEHRPEFLQIIVPWEGFKDFDAYCRPLYGDNRPSPCESPH